MFNNQSYDEYIRSVLGYEPVYEPYGRNYNYMPNINLNTSSRELEDYYPDIYKVVYPMVQSVCVKNTRPLTRELVDDLTNEVYMAVEGNEAVQLNINLKNQIDNSNRNVTDIPKNKNEIQSSDKLQNKETRESRQFNRGLSDIIRILILRELLGVPGGFFPGPGPRPPRPPMRPPFPPQCPGCGPRPPYNREFDIYEF